jgi:hypothetical protein
MRYSLVVLALILLGTLASCGDSGPAEPPPRYTLEVIITGDGGGSVSSSPTGIDCGSDCDASFEEGTIVTLSAEPETGSSFAGWSGGGCGGTGACAVTIEASVTVSASFTMNSYALLVETEGAGSGTVFSDPAGIECGEDCSEDYTHGMDVVLTAFPDDGFAFAGWEGAGCEGLGACAFTITSEVTVAAAFEPMVAAWPDSHTRFCIQDSAEVTCPGGPVGQDGHYEVRVPSYTVVDGRVHDSVTGLTWERLPPFTLLAKADALTYCGNLALDGLSDWRVPSRLELASIADAGRHGPPFPSGVFPDIPGNSYFWSRNADPANPTRSWVMNTNWATSSFRDNDEVENSPGDGNIVRCVRGPALLNDLSVAGNTVVDQGTGLTWQSGTAPALLNWVDALAYCEALVLEGEDDWRLPSIKEWFSIVDDTLAAAPRISLLFAERPTIGTSVHFWSSTPLPREDDSDVYVLNTSNGTSLGIGTDITSERNARCVR